MLRHIFIICLLFSVSAFANEDTKFSFGGQLNSTFSNRTGELDSHNATSGYGWVLAEKSFDDARKISWNAGISFERSNYGQVLLNQSFLEYDLGYGAFSMGRMIEAAGKLHHDFYDFGAPAIADNAPISFFTSGNYPINVTQQLAHPFANRTAFYNKQIRNSVLGVSYTPFVSQKHPAGFRYYTNGDFRNSLSLATVSEWTYRNWFMGGTAGRTMGRYNDTHLYHSGDAYANQYSLYMRQEKGWRGYNMYEFGYGCLDGDRLERECRAGWQISRVRGKTAESVAFKRRLTNQKTVAYDDYSAGYMYFSSQNTRIGLEHILRVRREYKFSDGEFQWNFGISIDS